MSYDELPPDAQPQSEDAAAQPAQDPSSQDAPPAAPTRRRRTRTAGSDAASQPETTPTTTPARTTRRRTAVTAAGTTHEPAAAASLEGIAQAASEPLTAAPEPEAKSSRRRRVAKTEAAADTPPAAPDTPPVAATPDVEAAAAEPTKPARRTRRTRPAAPETIAAETSQPGQEPVAGAPETPVEAPAERPQRRRNQRKSAKTEASAVLPVAPPEAEPAFEGEAPAAAPELADAGRKKGGRQRGGRSRRQTSTPETAETAEAVAAESAEQLAPSIESPDASPETTVPTEAPPGGAKDASEKRKRGNRRNGRNRRGGKESVAVEEPEVEPIAELVPPETIEEPIDLTVGTHLVVRNGLPTIFVNGIPYPPVLFFGNLEGMKNRQRILSEVRRAARAGVHLHSTLVELPCPLSESGEALDEIDGRLRAILEADPEGHVMPRIVFLPARGWKREYPTEISAYSDGTNGDPSLTSSRFWQECERSLEALIAHIHNQVWADRVFGYHLERGEWFQPADQGFDRSMANRDAFRDWLREKYQHDLVGLRAAWYDGDVQFHTAEIPTLPAKPNPQRAFYETRRERSQIDFNEFTSESTARLLISLARTVKKATANNALVSLCYGYTFEFGHGYSGHLALDLLLADRHIDLVCGPPSYRDRKPGGAASIPAPADSVALYGKLWLSEDDTKTYLAPTQQEPDDFNPRLSDRFQTEQAQQRAVGRALATDIATGWMDLWGEGWLDEDAMWDRIGAFASRLRVQQEREPHLQSPDVIALIDEKSLLHIQKGEPFFRRLTNGLRDTLQRAGISYAAYLQSDLLHPEFPTGARLYLFLTPFRLPTEQRTAIKEKLQGGGKTLVWLYAPGSCEARPGLGGLMEETATGATGLILRQQAWNSEIGSRITVANHPLTDRLGGKDIGSRERLNPSFYVDDPGATVLAEYQGSGLGSLAVKDNGNWKSVFVGDPVLPLELLRGICRYAGVHLWTGGGEDVVNVGNGWVMVHASRDGQRTLRLPASTPLYDVTERRLVSNAARDYRYFLRAGCTRLFYAASLDEMRRMGLPNVPEDGAGRDWLPLDDSIETARPEADILLLPEPPESELPPLLPPTVAPTLNTDLETLKAVLSMEMPETDDFEMEEQDDLEITLMDMDPAPATATLAQVLGAEVTTNGRRRRRRGGRGRGRRRDGSTEPNSAGAEPQAGNGETAPLPDVTTIHNPSTYESGETE
jgi:hypothetical protein